LPREISEREEELPKQMIGELIRIAAEGRDIISLGPGEPDFTTPKHIINFARKRLGQGYTHYSPPGGRAELKEAVCRKLKKENRIKAGPEQVVVTTGSTEAIMLALMCMIDPGEGVIIPDPGFLAYKPSVEILNGIPISLPLKEEDGFQLDIRKARERVVPEKTMALILNTPSNPTGTVFTRKTLERIADFAVEYELFIISDEAYEKLVYGDARHISIGSLNGMEDYVLTLHSFSKTYAMPGFRVGYAAGPERIIKAMSRVHVYTSICAPTVSQEAALKALTGPQGCIEKMRREYDRRRKLIVEGLNRIGGFRCLEPRGAFYAFPNISEFGMSSAEFARWLLKNARVAVVPGTEFGMHGEGFIRCSYATSYKKIESALERMEKALKKLR
jgi:aminotransferase